MHYFDKNWDTEHTSKYKREMRKAVKQEWESNYRDQAGPDERPLKRVTVLDKHLNRASSISMRGDEFDKYTSAMPVTFASPTATTLLQWWARLGPQQLRQMAYDLLSIPCTSCECERAFSSAKRTMTVERMSLKHKTIEQCELLRNWWRQGMIQQPTAIGYHDGDGEDEIEDGLPYLEGASDDE
jgi:hypothetical protein